MSQRDYYGFDTLSLHAGAAPDSDTGARATPIYLSASFVFRDSDHAAALFNMEQAGHVYSRISNPTVAVLEERIAALEAGVGAIATASGPAALALSCGLVLPGKSACTAPTLTTPPKPRFSSSGLRVVTLMVPAMPPSNTLACEVL